ncbi:MAG: hypothetical protein ACYDCO_23405 [Armatimonadota bacterium]
MFTLDWKVTSTDVAHLRELAKRVREAAESELNQECIRRWYAHDENRGERPLILTETDGGIRMVLPDYVPKCSEPWAQAQEWGLIGTLMHFETIKDDCPIEPWINCGWEISRSGYGVETHATQPTTDGSRGAYHIDAVMTDLERDFEKLRPATFSVNRESSLAVKAQLEEVYDGTLGVRMRGNPWWTMGLTWTAILYIGLEGLMLYMYDQPEALHRFMQFLSGENLRFLDWMEAEGLLNLNNENDYCGSGSRGYTRRLPGPDFDGTVRTQHMWTLLESQETVGVGPELYEEFIFPYENAIAKRFGSVYYGCCEPVNTRWHVLEQMAGLKRVSVSPWCDENFMAEACGTQYVYSRKPNPALVSTERFDEAVISADLRKTIEVTKAHNCSTEIAMKDVHTLSGEPDRLTRWVQIAREEVVKVYG